MPATGAHRRAVPVPRSIITKMTEIVTLALSGAACAGASGGSSFSMPRRIGITVTGRSITTVPVTAGVRTRCSSESRVESIAWATPEMMTRVASSPGPPCSRASVQTAMKIAELTCVSAYPAPIRPTRTPCRIAETPHARTEASTAQKMSSSASPARNTIVGNSTTPLMARATSCKPRPSASGAEIRSSTA